jgi:hypothetical protein
MILLGRPDYRRGGRKGTRAWLGHGQLQGTLPACEATRFNGTVQWWSGSCRGRRGSIIRAVREQEREDDRSTRLRLGVIMYAGRRESDTRRRS